MKILAMLAVLAVVLTLTTNTVYIEPERDCHIKALRKSLRTPEVYDGHRYLSMISLDDAAYLKEFTLCLKS